MLIFRQDFLVEDFASPELWEMVQHITASDAASSSQSSASQSAVRVISPRARDQLLQLANVGARERLFSAYVFLDPFSPLQPGPRSSLGPGMDRGVAMPNQGDAPRSRHRKQELLAPKLPPSEAEERSVDAFAAT